MKLRQDGFTLLELLIAVALLALVMSMLATALTASVKVVETVSEQDDAALQAKTGPAFSRQPERSPAIGG